MVKDTHKFLLSSPSYFVGDHEGEEIRVHHVFGEMFQSGSSHSQKNVLDSSHHLVVFETDKPSATDLNKKPNYYPVGEVVSQVMTVFYGKLVIPVGFIETAEILCIPKFVDCSRFQKIFPFYSNSIRRLNPVELNRVEIKNVALLGLSEDFICASRLYQQALWKFMEMPDMAYLNLVNAGETLSRKMRFSAEDLHDERPVEYLKEIEESCPNGAKIASHFRSSMRQIKRKYFLGLNSAKDCDVYNHEFDRQVVRAVASPLTRENFESAIKASYDLRFKVLHEGVQIGSSVSFWQTEVGLIYDPSMSDELKKILGKAPSFVCLERIVRCALLNRLLEESQRK